jgi:hypothetical protein
MDSFVRNAHFEGHDLELSANYKDVIFSKSAVLNVKLT